jgi:hypothetical protein
MSSLAKEFLGLSLGAIVVYLILAHYTGAEHTLSAAGKSTSEVFKTLQGRG